MVIDSLQKAFECDDIKEKVLKPEWLLKNRESGIHSTGFCYAASEVIYRLTGGSAMWIRMAISKNDWIHGGH